MFEKCLGLTTYTGTFLDIGSFEPIENNNTYELERRGWRGILFDQVKECEEKYKRDRKSQYVIGDVTILNWLDVLSEKGYAKGHTFDYLSLDVDDATLSVVKNFPWLEYKFRFITAEHDIYKDGVEKKKEMYDTFTKLGYICLHENVCNEFNPYEDWWVHPELVDLKKLPQYVSRGLDWTHLMPALERDCK